MQIIRRPRRLWGISMLLFTSLPLVILNIWVLQKGSSVDVFLKNFFKHSHIPVLAVVGAWCGITFYWLKEARQKGFWSVFIFSAILLMGNAFWLVKTKNYALGFYALFMFILSALYLIYIYRHFLLVYYNPGRKWYEGMPKFIPGLQAWISSESSLLPVKVSRLELDGCYLYNGPIPESSNKIKFNFGENEFSCGIQLISRTKDKIGYGVRFVINNSDQDKDVKDFVDRLRSLGYVA